MFCCSLSLPAHRMPTFAWVTSVEFGASFLRIKWNSRAVQLFDAFSIPSKSVLYLLFYLRSCYTIGNRFTPLTEIIRSVTHFYLHDYRIHLLLIYIWTFHISVSMALILSQFSSSPGSPSYSYMTNVW